MKFTNLSCLEKDECGFRQGVARISDEVMCAEDKKQMRSKVKEPR